MKIFRDSWTLATICILLLALTIFVFYLDWSSHRGLVVSVLDIGQGDAIFIESPTGVQVLVDAGPPGSIMGALPHVMPPLDRSLDAIIMTHPDQDHIGGFESVLKTYRIGAVLEPGVYGDSSLYKNIEKEIQTKGIPEYLARKGMRLDLGGGAMLEIIFPDRDVTDWETNDASVVARLTYGVHSFMLTGDSTIDSEELILKSNKPENLTTEFLKVGHHGSRTSTSYEYMKALRPRYALISSGKNNKYGHPNQEVLDILNEFNTEILRTDELGTVTIECDTIDPCQVK